MRLRFRFVPTMSREPAHASHAPGLGHSYYIPRSQCDFVSASLQLSHVRSHYKKITAWLYASKLARHAVFFCIALYLELSSLCCFFYRNSNARIYRIRWRFCCLYVSYSSIFIPIQHFSRLI